MLLISGQILLIEINNVPRYHVICKYLGYSVQCLHMGRAEATQARMTCRTSWSPSVYVVVVRVIRREKRRGKSWDASR